MDALAGHEVRQSHARGQHFDAHFTAFGFRAVFFYGLQSVGAAIVRHNDSRVFHRNELLATSS